MIGFKNFSDLIKNHEIFTKAAFLLLSFFVLSSVLNASWYLKFSLYFLTLLALTIVFGIKKLIFKGFLNFYPYLIFTVISLISFLSLQDHSFELQNSPQIENVIALFTLFIFLSQLQSYYQDIMESLIKITAIFLLISVPVHFFYYGSSFLTATMFVTNIENESFGSKNTLAILLVILFPYCMYMLSKKMSVYNFSIVILFIIAIFYTFSRSALILLLLSFPLLLMSRDRKLIKASFITVLIITFISLSFQISPSKYNELKLETKKQIENNSSLDINSINSFSTESARFDYISKSVYGFVEKPVFGHGFSSFRRNHAYFDDKGEHIRNPVTHNDYAQVLYEMGILGIVSFLYLFFFNLKRLLRSFNRDQVRNTIIFSQIILLGVALNAINLLDHAIFWVIMALTLTRKTNNKHSQSTIIET